MRYTNMLYRMYQGSDAAMTMSAGSNHVLLVHRSGQLYTWGVGASGRLGLDLTQGGNPQVPAHNILFAFCLVCIGYFRTLSSRFENRVSIVWRLISETCRFFVVLIVVQVNTTIFPKPNRLSFCFSPTIDHSV